jgi:O-antigen ligase
MSAAYLTRQEHILKLPRVVLLSAMTLLWTATIVAFSRSAWANLLVTLLVFAIVSRQVRLRRVLIFVSLLVLPLAAFAVYSPELWNYLVMNRIGSSFQIFDDPDMVSSWRIATWKHIGAIFQDYPHYLIFGVGYKSLSHSRLFHDRIITDNGYLNLLLETGIVGLSGFLLFSASVFKTFWGISRRATGAAAFWSLFLFSFWCGESVQLLVADAYTYWRNMLVFLALMALVMNWMERERERSLSASTAGPA